MNLYIHTYFYKFLTHISTAKPVFRGLCNERTVYSYGILYFPYLENLLFVAFIYDTRGSSECGFHCNNIHIHTFQHQITHTHTHL